MRHFIMSLAVLTLLTGCLVSRAQRQAAANALAGTEAVETEVPVVYAPVIKGIKNNIRTAVRDTELPPPEMTPEEIRADKTGYEKESEKDLADMQSSFWGEPWFYVTLSVVLGIAAKVFPQADPAISLAMAWLKALLSKDSKEELESTERKAEGFGMLVREIEDLPAETDVQYLKSKVQGHLPSAINDLIIAEVDKKNAPSRT